MANYITTYTGKQLDPFRPRAELICVEDIAHALSLLCRGNGHVRTFWSVGQHCICCAKEAAARGMSDRLVLACLLHDASECYLSDVPSPLKAQLPVYQQQEARLMSLLYEKFLGSNLTAEEQAQLKEIDQALLWYDLEHLLGEPHHPNAPELHITIDYSARPFASVEEEYLAIFSRYAAQKMEETTVQDELFMKRAIELSKQAVEHGNEPFGAVLVKNGKIVFTNENQIYSRHDPTFHGEAGLLREFCAQTEITDLHEYTMYSSCEPCFMCSGAMVWVKLGRLVYGASNNDLEELLGNEGCNCSKMVFDNSFWHPEVTAGVLKEESLVILEEYFAQHEKG